MDFRKLYERSLGHSEIATRDFAVLPQSSVREMFFYQLKSLCELLKGHECLYHSGDV